MGTAAALLAEARRSLGLSGRPNYITRDYAKRHGRAYLRAPWCDMAVTYWARASGNTAAVLPKADRAYTVWHADDFRKAGRWHVGTVEELNRAQPGDIVFFDWGQSNRIGAVDHVGVVERTLGGGRVQTIEGNTGDRCLRRVRSAGAIAGYGRPAYTRKDDDMEPTTRVDIPDYWEGKHFSHGSYSAAFLWAGSLSETRAYGKAILAKLDAQQATIDKLVDALQAAQPDLDALKAEIRRAIDSVSVPPDADEQEEQQS